MTIVKILSLSLLGLAAGTLGQGLKAQVSEPKEILLWPAGAPGSEGKTAPEKVRIAEAGDHVISSIHHPSITPYLPAPAEGTGAAVIIAPGGGHVELWIDHEGYNPAKWLRAHGVAAFVLKYRLAKEAGSTYTIDKDELADMQRAIRMVRSRAKEWGIDTSRIGVMGFSAGGEVAALSAMRFDNGHPDATDPVERLCSRPDFQALIYPGGSSRFEVVAGAPPLFLVGGYKDRADIAEGIAEVYLKYKKAGVPAELHIYAGVGHGFGMRATNTGGVAGWIDRFGDWLSDMGFLKAGKPVAGAAVRGPVAGVSYNMSLPGNGAIHLMWIGPGSFVMGSPSSESGRKPDEGPETQVTLSKGYWIGKTELTIGQWKAVTGVNLRDQVINMLNDDTVYDFGDRRAILRDYMNFDRNDPEKIMANEGDSLPMYFVSWNDAEFASPAGSMDATYSSALDKIAWYGGNSHDGYQGRKLGRSGAGPRNSGEKMANAWGLQDVYGNLWEWCRDWYGSYPGGTIVDSVGPVMGTGRVNRGGSWGSGAADERSANRAKNPQPEKSAYRGFRVALCPVG